MAHPAERTVPTFLSLPPEIRCHIYNYLPELVEKRVFPVERPQRVSRCCWSIYRLPTALLQTHQLVRAETQDGIVQRNLRRLNEQCSPSMVVGPFFHKAKPFLYVASCFHHVVTGRLKAKDPAMDEVDWIVQLLVCWFNLKKLNNPDMIWVPSDAFPGIDVIRRCCKYLKPFVELTLARMKFHNQQELDLRVLIRGSRLRTNRRADTRVVSSLARYLFKIRHESFHRIIGVATSLTLVFAPEIDEEFVSQTRFKLRAYSPSMMDEVPTLPERVLFARSSFFDHRDNYQEWETPAEREADSHYSNQWHMAVLFGNRQPRT